MTTPKERPAGSIGFQDVSRLVQEGIIRADEAQEVIDLLVQKRDAGQEPFITPDEIPRTGTLSRLKDTLSDAARDAIPSPSEAFQAVEAGATGGVSVPLRDMLTNLFTPSPIETGQVEQALGRVSEPTEEPEAPPATATAEPTQDAADLGAQAARAGAEGEEGFETRTVTLSDGTEIRMVNVPSMGGWVTEEELRQLTEGGGGNIPFTQTREGLEFQAALRRAEQAAQAGEDRATRQVESQLQREQARKQREQERQLQQEQIEAQQQRQQQQTASQLLGQLFQIASSPASRLRFLNAQAEGQSSLGQTAQAGGLGGDQFTQLLNAAGLNPENQNFTVENRFAEMFGMQPGTEVDFAAPAGDTNIVPNLGQISDLTPEETQELDALTEILFGRRFSDIQRKSRELAPPGGNIQNLNVR